MKNALKTLNILIQTAPRFKRAINLEYDISASDIIASFIPTSNAVDAISERVNHSEKIEPYEKKLLELLANELTSNG